MEFLIMKKLQFTSARTVLQSQRGFSLIEILIALTLMGIAGTFVAGKIFDQFHEGKVKAAITQMGMLSGTLKEFNRKCNFYPTTDQGLESLVSKPSGRECKNYPPGGFFEDGQLPKDPWEADYAYESDGKTFDIISYGADNQPGGEDKDCDISFRKGGCVSATPGAEGAGSAESEQ
ncbi:MAG: type II secretion system protein GspG [Bdellovibrio sp. CG12_big_fil_rev_8_21_14_0_65_39_13]|nr:MAG: type II secretion system protein GspG [Bdellovibrio sp. CG22_combo_CG10-13_8_21_14_all_39_27]PIQ61456.1 MAG: type II secretion system protein GspG [Bdellovibrio sp. CG12_big_fil_rev_8_21_14_0_65_39_13]PIR35302.1 MAG: type II secretion system protein GspG [Bdellovibrio sp. CG11_big_fil_rev_8_21_14_0_20_39_38]